MDALRAMQARFPCHSVRIAGRDWRIRDSGGDGPVLVLLPGGLGNADIFYHQMLGLSPGLRCIAADYPGGDGAAMADGLAGLLDHLGLARASLLGSSLGGYWLQHFGARHPSRVAAMILANSFCTSDQLRGHPLFSVPRLSAIEGEALKTEWLAMLEARAPDELRDVQIDLLRHGQNGERLRGRLLAAATAPSAPEMPDGAFPIFLLDCADDPILAPATRDELAARYPDARRLTLPTGGHYPSITQAHRYNRFLHDCTAPGRKH